MSHPAFTARVTNPTTGEPLEVFAEYVTRPHPFGPAAGRPRRVLYVVCVGVRCPEGHRSPMQRADAAALTRRLLNFCSTDHGNEELLARALAELLGSLGFNPLEIA